MYIRKEIYSVSDILRNYSYKDNRILDGDLIRSSSRYSLFFQKGVKCKKCGISGTFFAKERSPSPTDKPPYKWHLNLYGNDRYGNEIMITKDHIYPQSLGGTNHIDNLQTMCQSCNLRKGNKI